MTVEKAIEVCKNHGWNVDLENYSNGQQYLIAQHSPAGEDFSFNIDADESGNNFANEVRMYSATFDPDDHIEMWIEARKNGVKDVPSTRELVKDAEAIEKMLQTLAAALTEAEYESNRMQNI